MKEKQTRIVLEFFGDYQETEAGIVMNDIYGIFIKRRPNGDWPMISMQYFNKETKEWEHS